MYKDKTFLALIPARGGSKGLPGKNIKPLGGKPLIAWSIKAALESAYIDEHIVTTDDPAIADAARAHGGFVPYQRPDELATDTALMMNVIMHTMDYAEKAGKACDYLVLLQVTSPFRGAKDVDSAIEYRHKQDADVILGVTETSHSPLLCNILPDDNRMNNFYSKNLQNLNRQDMKPYYRVNGAMYIAEWNFMRKYKGWLSDKTFAYVMDRKSSVDIDHLQDFLLAQAILEHEQRNAVPGKA